MSVIVEFTLPAEEFILGRALQGTTGLSVELEQMIPTGDATIPYFWVVGADHSQFATVLEREQELSSCEVVDELDGRRLYRVEWNPAVDTFVQTVVEHDAVLQSAGGDANSWQFQLRFPDSSEVSEFRTACRNRGIDLTVEGLFHSVAPSTGEPRALTEGQQSLIERAYDEGYFEIPRQITLAELAESLGISDQAVNERLRRGLSALIEATLKAESN